MASKSFELLPLTALVSNRASRADKILDLGGYNTIQLHAVVPVAGSQGDKICIQTSAVNEDDMFFNISSDDGGEIPVDAPVDGTLVTITNFLRYIRWKTGTIAGTPKAAIWGIAKE